jgi:hypothetical protein
VEIDFPLCTIGVCNSQRACYVIDADGQGAAGLSAEHKAFKPNDPSFCWLGAIYVTEEVRFEVF